MKKTPKQKLGFTLLELLVVVAIIGVLAAVSLTLLSNNKRKATRAKALTMLRGALSIAQLCDTTPTGLISYNGGGNMCDDPSVVGTWPSLSGIGWSYSVVEDTDPNDGMYYFKAAEPSSSSYVECNQDGCVFVP